MVKCKKFELLLIEDVVIFNRREVKMEAEININFRKAFELVINGYEGKYSNDKDDPGGETYKGIARNMNKDFEGWGIIDNLRGNGNFPESLEGDNLLQSYVRDFYKKNYWDKFMGDKMVLHRTDGEEGSI